MQLWKIAVVCMNNDYFFWSFSCRAWAPKLLKQGFLLSWCFYGICLFHTPLTMRQMVTVLVLTWLRGSIDLAWIIELYIAKYHFWPHGHIVTSYSETSSFSDCWNWFPSLLAAINTAVMRLVSPYPASSANSWSSNESSDSWPVSLFVSFLSSCLFIVFSSVLIVFSCVRLVCSCVWFLPPCVACGWR